LRWECCSRPYAEAQRMDVYVAWRKSQPAFGQTAAAVFLASCVLLVLNLIEAV
jgi:hypothetical protein